MRQVHCRKCWQLTPLLTRRCAHCGHTDDTRRLLGLAELALGILSGAAAIGLFVWIVSAYG